MKHRSFSGREDEPGATASIRRWLKHMAAVPLKLSNVPPRTLFITMVLKVVRQDTHDDYNVMLIARRSFSQQIVRESTASWCG